MLSDLKFWGALVLTALVAVGCGESNSPGEEAADRSAAPDAAYLLSAAPADAQGVGQARQSSQDEDEVTIVGRIGGSAEPFVDGLAAFTIVDPKVAHCSPEEGCPTPWDYCCTQNEVKENIATVKVVNGQGRPVAKDARRLLGVKELSTVVVRGKAQRDESGNLSVLAEKVYVQE